MSLSAEWTSERYECATSEKDSDHSAANIITKKAIGLLEKRPKSIQYFLSPEPSFSFDDAKEDILEIDISEFYELKKKALTFFDCHHKVVVEGQTEPVIANNLAAYLAKLKRVIIEEGKGFRFSTSRGT